MMPWYQAHLNSWEMTGFQNSRGQVMTINHQRSDGCIYDNWQQVRVLWLLQTCDKGWSAMHRRGGQWLGCYLYKREREGAGEKAAISWLRRGSVPQGRTLQYHHIVPMTKMSLVLLQKDLQPLTGSLALGKVKCCRFFILTVGLSWPLPSGTQNVGLQMK